VIALLSEVLQLYSSPERRLFAPYLTHTYQSTGRMITRMQLCLLSLLALISVLSFNKNGAAMAFEFEFSGNKGANFAPGSAKFGQFVSIVEDEVCHKC